ncbi:FtsW/RodA/SpoVE family cell cycle protein [Brooklawnia cerclae]|uniref:Cell division protein FtsW (Lipid II flippase) n=1 Tax=Brooklawnia cerclae TaxID=349934 RepID=A0ABX0SPT0_9ACTN|nr:FtsW/RodA/SpoVE family cell cycle protein [Brooklawnia cerclae]NIH58762.1 cell division protein FtsW (lipid II flippase) [Brooklawnia cerclae]
MTAQAVADQPVVVYHKRRNTELVLVLAASLMGIGGWLITHINRDDAVPSNWWLIAGVWLLVCVGAHVVVRLRSPYADPVILPCVLALNGLGLAMIHRIDLGNEPVTNGATNQLVWTVLGVVLFALVLVYMRDYRVLQGLSYVLFLAGMVLLLLPLVPGLASRNNDLNGSQIWIEVFGYSFQPAEIAKIALTLAFASYLTENRDLLQLAGRRVLGFQLPRMRDLIPVLVMWAGGIIVLVFENDLGTSLLFFGLFIMMLYVATSQARWVVIGGVLFTGAALAVGRIAPHVATRVSSWLDPFSNYDVNYQIITAQYGMAWGGLFGKGWGLGRPGLTPVASSDFISAAIAEELGLAGLVAVLLIYMLMIGRGLRTALTSSDVFGKLLAAGFSFVFALQVFAIVGGVTRLLPLTGLTTPFMSQGGSSLIANWVIVAILLQISHEARQPVPAEAPLGSIANLADDRTALIDVKPGGLS